MIDMEKKYHVNVASHWTFINEPMHKQNESKRNKNQNRIWKKAHKYKCKCWRIIKNKGIKQPAESAEKTVEINRNVNVN